MIRILIRIIKRSIPYLRWVLKEVGKLLLDDDLPTSEEDPEQDQVE